MYRSLLVALTPGGFSDAPARYAVALAKRENLRETFLVQPPESLDISATEVGDVCCRPSETGQPQSQRDLENFERTTE